MKTTYILVERQFENGSTIHWYDVRSGNISNRDNEEIKIGTGGFGYNYLLHTDKILQTLVKDDEEFEYEDLDFSLTSIYQNLWNNKDNISLGSGWLSLTGEMFYCDYQEHSAFADYIFKKSEREMEDVGFMKIYKEIETSKIFPALNKRYSLEQANWLKENGCGYLVHEEDIIYQ